MPPYLALVDELDIIHELLRDENVNFHFNELVPYDGGAGDTPGGSPAANDHHLTQEPAWTEEQFPNVFMTTTDINGIAWGDSRHAGYLTDVYMITVVFRIQMRRDQILNYGTQSFHKSTKGLRAIYDVLSAIFGHHTPFKSDVAIGTSTGFLTFSDVRGVGVGIQFGKADISDAIDTLVATWQFDVEKSYTYDSSIALP